MNIPNPQHYKLEKRAEPFAKFFQLFMLKTYTCRSSWSASSTCSRTWTVASSSSSPTVPSSNTARYTSIVRYWYLAFAQISYFRVEKWSYSEVSYCMRFAFFVPIFGVCFLFSAWIRFGGGAAITACCPESYRIYFVPDFWGADAGLDN